MADLGGVQVPLALAGRKHSIRAQGRPPHQRQANRILVSSSFWVLVAVLAAIEVGIVVAALRMRTVNPSGGILGSRPAEVLWTLMPTVLLVALVILSFRWLSSS